MNSIGMGIAPGRTTTRVVAMQGASETILKARLRRDPSHPRALATRLEAIALWQGMAVRAALVADDEPTSYASSLCQSPLSEVGVGPLFSVAWVPVAGRNPRRSALGRMGGFHDLERRLLREVAQ